MSGYTGTLFEELYSNAAGATTTTPTASAVSTTAGLPSIEIPGGYFTGGGKKTSSVRLKIAGQLTTTATIPTWLFGVAWTQALPATFNATNVLAACAAFTPGTAVTGAWYELEMDISLRTLALGAASAVISHGRIECPEAFPPAAYSATSGASRHMPAANVSGVSGATIDVDQPLFLWPYVTLGAATAGNTVTTQIVKLYGEN